jgi:PAS domain S-box-containing protein
MDSPNRPREHPPSDQPRPAGPGRGTESLRRVEEHFDQLVAGVRDYAIFLLDASGRVASWNSGAERIKGYRAEDIIGEHVSRFYPAEAIASQWPQQELKEAARTGRFEDEGWRLRKDGTRFWANVVITALYGEGGALRGYLKITRDLTERKAVEEQLKSSQVELEERVRERTAQLARLDQHRNQFLAMLGHELRNPLAPIRNALEILKVPELDDAGRERAHQVIERQVEHLVHLVDDLLDVSRILHGKFELRRERIDLTTAVARAVEIAQPMLDAHGHALDLDLPSEPVWVDGDLVRLAQVMTNLLANAAKFTPQPGRIELSVQRSGSDIAIHVRDPGVGIDPALLPNVFDFFVQGEHSLARTQGGLGIGLALVKHIVERHGGAVSVDSGGSGKGTDFTLRLPAEPPRPTAEERQLPSRQSQGPRHRVLVVDDNLDAAESLVALLEVWGHEASACHDGPSAVTAAVELRPAVVLLDIGLPGMDGYEVARQIQALPDNPVRLLAALTGYGQQEDRERSAAAGFNVHLTKPVDPARLRALLAETPG